MSAPARSLEPCFRAGPSSARGFGGADPDAVLAGQTDPVPPPGHPPAGSYPVRRCLRAVTNEEWLHRLYAERGIAVLEQRG